MRKKLKVARYTRHIKLEYLPFLTGSKDKLTADALEIVNTLYRA